MPAVLRGSRKEAQREDVGDDDDEDEQYAVLLVGIVWAGHQRPCDRQEM